MQPRRSPGLVRWVEYSSCNLAQRMWIDVEQDARLLLGTVELCLGESNTLLDRFTWHLRSKCVETPIGNYQKGWSVVASSSEWSEKGEGYHLGKSRRPQDRSVLTASAGTGKLRVLNGARSRSERKKVTDRVQEGKAGAVARFGSVQMRLYQA